MSEEGNGGDKIIDGILIVVSGALFTLGALAITAAWGKGSRMLREARGFPKWKRTNKNGDPKTSFPPSTGPQQKGPPSKGKRTNKTGIQKPYFHTTAHQQEGPPSKGKRTNKTGIRKPYFHTTAHQQEAIEQGTVGRLPGEGILLEARGFPKGKRTNNDGSHNATFTNTDAQQKAKDEGRWGKPLGSKNKPKK